MAKPVELVLFVLLVELVIHSHFVGDVEFAEFFLPPRLDALRSSFVI